MGPGSSCKTCQVQYSMHRIVDARPGSGIGNDRTCSDYLCSSLGNPGLARPHLHPHNGQATGWREEPKTRNSENGSSEDILPHNSDLNMQGGSMSGATDQPPVHPRTAYAMLQVSAGIQCTTFRGMALHTEAVI